MGKLTDTKIRNTKAGNRVVKVSDGHGLYLQITPAGGKLWRWKYRFEGRERLMALGQYPVVSLMEARKRHAAGRALLESGIDPAAKKKEEKLAAKAAEAHSFQAVAEQWHEHWKAGKSLRHADTVMRRLRADVFPVLGHIAVTEIEAPALVALAQGIQDRGALDIAKRSLETMGQVFRYAVAHGLAKRNPAADIKPADILQSRQKVNYARIEAKELPALLRAIEVYQGTPLTRLALKLLAHTFVRTGELIGARWSEIDMEARRWNLPAERMKMRTPHVVPLSSQVVEVLELLTQVSGSGELLFPGDRDPKLHMSNNTILKALERMGYKGIMTGHGFRGIASTILHEQGYPHEHIELQLAHAPRNAVSAAYNHALYLEPRAKMMQGWSDYLEQQQRGKVVEMKAG